MNYDVGVIVGRFQVPEFHAGHLHLLDSIYRNHKQMLVCLGVAPESYVFENPLDFSLRQQMIRDLYSDAIVVMLRDVPGDDAAWSAELDQIIAYAVPNRSVCLYGGRESFIEHYKGKHKTTEILSVASPSGTELRNNIDAKNADANFRRGVIYGIRYQYPHVTPTVDVALLDTNRVLMGRKRSVSGLVFPGGFVSPSDESFEIAAARELLEETGMALASGANGLRYIASMQIDDWRYRGRRDKIVTTLFVGDYSGGSPKAADDLSAVEWLDIRYDSILKVADHHKPLFGRLLSEVA